MSSFKSSVKRLLPPPVLSMLKKAFRHETVEYWGDFGTWEDAVQASGSYDNPSIFERVRDARMKVLSGEAAYERDSVLFPKIQYFWPVLCALLIAAAKNNNTLNLMDFGGSLGTSFYQNKALLSHLKPLRWNIVEQKRFVDFGKKNLESSELHFYDTFDECTENASPDIFLISSVLQYLPDPYRIIEQVLDYRFTHLIFDRTTVLSEGSDRIVVQNVPKKIYPSDFPARLFNEKTLLARLEKRYRLVFDFYSIGDPITLDKGQARNKGYFFERIS